jgi:hypothetical protein
MFGLNSTLAKSTAAIAIGCFAAALAPIAQGLIGAPQGLPRLTSFKMLHNGLAVPAFICSLTSAQMLATLVKLSLNHRSSRLIRSSP